MKKYILFFGTAVIPGLVMFGCMILLLSGKVSVVCNGFATDANQALYIGQENKIIVLQENTVIREIFPITSRGYRFTILNGDTILLSTGSTVYTMDLEGNVLTKDSDERSTVYNSLQFQKEFVDIHGEKYYLKNLWGRTRIFKDNTLIYQTPAFDYSVIIIMVISAGMVGILGTIAAIMRFRGTW